MHHHLVEQSGVVSRAQLVACGFKDHDIARLVRRKELVALQRGIFIEHSGQPTWLQRAWVAVLLCRARGATGTEPDVASAALRGRSALVAAGLAPPRERHCFEVVVADERRLTVPPEVDVRRSSAMLSLAQWHVGPPRVRLEEAVIDVAAGHARMVDLVAEVSRAIGSRRTTARRLIACLDGRARVAQRDALRTVLRDLSEGTCSSLEHGYLTRVERPHGLPAPARQSRARSRTSATYRDAEYEGLVVELDGRAWHDSVEQRDRDADRDLVAAATGSRTVRLTWGQIYDRPCWTAAQVGRLLGVAPGRCGPTCTVLDS